MKSDLDHLMQDRGLDALLVLGSALHNPAMAFFTGRIHMTGGYLLKVRGQQPVLFHQAMEREEAASSGLQTKDLGDYDFNRLVDQSGGDQMAALALRFKHLFEEYGVSGKVALYGKTEFGHSFGALRLLEESLPEVELIGELAGRSVLQQARSTKDAEEVERIRKMGKVTTSVVGDVADFLSSHQGKDGRLLNRSGEVLTIGDVKRRINLWLAMRDAENPEGTLFSMGRDAAVPHNKGRDDQPVEVGKAIVFDLFPVEAGGGYFFDFTRTWAIGHASEELQQLHQDVLDVYEEVFAQLAADKPCREMQILACELFEAQGHPTVLNSPNTQDGYVHSLAHGIGLDVHEAPSFWQHQSNQDVLTPGMVFTFEPGLYYPDREIAVRIEDTVWLRPDGEFEVLAEYPNDLVLKVREAG